MADDFKTGYEHVPTDELAKLYWNLKAAKPRNAEHARELAEDIDLLNAEIARRV